MLDKDMKCKDAIGRRCTLDRAVNLVGAHLCLPAGTKATILDFGRAFRIKTDPCPCCGAYAVIGDVTRNSITLLPEEDKDRARPWTGTEDMAPDVDRSYVGRIISVAEQRGYKADDLYMEIDTRADCPGEFLYMALMEFTSDELRAAAEELAKQEGVTS